MFADTGGLSWKEPREDRERGECRVVITSLKPDASPGAVARLVMKQKEIETPEAEDEVAALTQGTPLECRFLDPGKARLFSMVCGMKGAVCQVVE